MKTIGAAIAVGLGASIAAAQAIEAQLFGIAATDPAVFAIVPVTLAAIALVACWLPARRASAVDPIQTLRAD
jgi:ABC-type lipoprotein release transport system permease subunit